MKVKLPKKLVLAGEELRVETPTNKKWFEAEGDFDKGIITIPLKDIGNREMLKLGLFLHETFELAMTARGYAYNATGRKLFVMNHDDFRNIIDDVAMACKDLKIT